MAETLEALLNAVDRADSAAALVGAVRALAAAGSEAAIPKLIEVLGYNNPGAAVAAVEGLVALGSVAVTPILNTLDGYDYGARAWANRALAKIGDPRALDNLLAAAQGDFALSVRRAAAQGLGHLHWAQLSASDQATGQQQALAALMQASQDGEWVVRYAAIAGLEGLAQAAPTLAATIQARLAAMAQADAEAALRGRARWALEKLSRGGPR